MVHRTTQNLLFAIAHNVDVCTSRNNFCCIDINKLCSLLVFMIGKISQGQIYGINSSCSKIENFLSGIWGRSITCHVLMMKTKIDTFRGAAPRCVHNQACHK